MKTYVQGKTRLIQLLVEGGGDNLHEAVTILTWWVIQRLRDQDAM
jgi:hypothetical protein